MWIGNRVDVRPIVLGNIIEGSEVRDATRFRCGLQNRVPGHQAQLAAALSGLPVKQDQVQPGEAGPTAVREHEQDARRLRPLEPIAD